MRYLEYFLNTSGTIMLAVVGAVFLDSFLGHRQALATFDAAREERSGEIPPAREPDQDDWSENRRSGYAKSLEVELGVPMAVLKIPSLDLEVPVFDGTDKLSLNRGAGHVDNTAAPGKSGNIAIAGHRDGFFRPLENIPIDTPIELATLDAIQNFEVTEILIVDPFDMTVLDDTETTTLTLITCYPFRYVGYAPDRYIVRARLVAGNNSNNLTKRISPAKTVSQRPQGQPTGALQ